MRRLSPPADSRPQGTIIIFPGDTPNRVVILVWRGYSQFTGRYYATYAEFYIEKHTKTIKPLEFHIKEPYKEWYEVRKNIDAYITDHVGRAVRKAVAEHTGVSYWRIVT